MKKGRISTGIIHHPTRGYDLLCFDGRYMFLGELDGLSIAPVTRTFAGETLEPGISKVVQLGEKRRNAGNKYLKFYPGNHLLYCGTVQGDTGELLVFEAYERNQPKDFPRNALGLVADDYKNLYVAFYNARCGELMVQTRCGTVRVLSAYIEFLNNEQLPAARNLCLTHTIRKAIIKEVRVSKRR